jgi:putative addiction module antidote
MFALKLTTVGNSEGFILPREVRDRMGLKRGDVVYLSKAPDGSFRLSPNDPEFARQMAVVERIMDEDRDVLLALAKR